MRNAIGVELNDLLVFAFCWGSVSWPEVRELAPKISAFLQADLQLPTLTWSVEVLSITCCRCDRFKVIESSCRIEKPWHATADCSAGCQIYQCTCSNYDKRVSFHGLHMQLHMFACIFPRRKRMSFAPFCSLPLVHHLPQEDGAIVARADGVKPPEVRLWHADSCDSHRMDFRFVSAKAEAEGTWKTGVTLVWSLGGRFHGSSNHFQFIQLAVQTIQIVLRGILKSFCQVCPCGHATSKGCENQGVEWRSTPLSSDGAWRVLPNVTEGHWTAFFLSFQWPGRVLPNWGPRVMV